MSVVHAMNERFEHLRPARKWATALLLPAFLLITLVIRPGDASAEEGEAGSGLSLRELEERAVANYPEIRAARAELDRLEAQLREVRWSPLSGLRVSGTLSPTPERRGDANHSAQGDISFSDTWGVLVRTEARLSIPLYGFGRLPAKLTVAREELVEGEQRVQSIERRTRLRVRRAYAALVLAEQSLSLLEEGRSYVNRASRYIEEALDNDEGDVTESDRLQIEVVDAEIDARISDARRAIRLARAGLRILSGLAEGETIETGPLEPLEFELDPLQTYLESALTRRPELELATARGRAARARRRAAFAGFFPEIRLVGDLDYAYSNIVDDQLTPFSTDNFNHLRFEMGIQLSWGLDFMSDRARLHQADARINRADAETDLARRRIDLEVEEAVITVEESQSVVNARRRSRRASRGWLVTILQGIDIGVLDPPELVDALRAYFEQSFLYLEAVSNLNESLGRLELIAEVEVEVE